MVMMVMVATLSADVADPADPSASGGIPAAAAGATAGEAARAERIGAEFRCDRARSVPIAIARPRDLDVAIAGSRCCSRDLGVAISATDRSWDLLPSKVGRWHAMPGA